MIFDVGDIVRYKKGYDYVILKVYRSDYYMIGFANPFSETGRYWKKNVKGAGLTLKTKNDGNVRI